MRLYYQNPGQSSEFIIDGADYDLSQTLENDIGNSLDLLSEIDHIRMGARVRAVSDPGDMLFLGVVTSIEYSASGGKRRYNCIAAEALLQCRQAPNIIYPGSVGLTLSDIFSSDAPPQGAGVTQYCMGLLWLSRSKICDGTDAGAVSWDSDGVGTLEGWGPLVAGCDIYYGGHKLTESTLSAITGGTYRYAISGGNLYVRGAGTGAIYDVVSADGWNENHMRLGTVATDSEVDALYNATETDIWRLVRDLVSETGQYIIFRRDGDYVYLDISATPKTRGSEAAPFASLHIGDGFGLQKISAPRYLPYACVVGMGAGAGNVEGARYARGELLSSGQAWLETTYQLTDARLPPWGHLDQATDDFFDAIHQDSPVDVVLYRDGFLPGDWLELDLGAGNEVIGQIRQISKRSSGYDVAAVGAPDLSLLTAFLERSETAAIETYRDRLVGEYSESVIISCGPQYELAEISELFGDDTETSIRCFASWGDRRLLIGTYPSGKIFRSVDGGATWGEVLDTPDSIVRTITTWENGYAVAGTHGGGKIYKSTDYGATWALITNLGASVVDLIAWPGGYAAAAIDNKLYRSTNYGGSWSLIGTYSYPEGTQSFVRMASWNDGHGIAGWEVHPCGFFGMTSRIYVTTNYGTSWSVAYDSGYGVGRYYHAMATFADGHAIVIGNYEGRVLLSSDFGASWSNDYDLGEGFDVYSCQAWDDGTAIIRNSDDVLYISKDYGDSFGVYSTTGDSPSIIYNIGKWQYGRAFICADKLYGVNVTWAPTTINFTPEDFDGEPGLILLSASLSQEQDNYSFVHTAAIVKVEVNGAVSAILAWAPSDNILSDLDISGECKLDGTEEEIKIYMGSYSTEPNSISCDVTIRGITKP